MDQIPLGTTGITVSRLGLGTGTADASGRCRQAAMDEGQFLSLVRFAHDRGITHWDTAATYDTHDRLAKVLREVERDRVVLTTKLVSASASEARRDLELALAELGTDYIDVCLIHAVRDRHDFEERVGAFEELIRSRQAGKIRAVGLSSHGTSALELALESPEVEVVWARINHGGVLMDTRRLGLYDRLATRPRLKKIMARLPKGVIAPIRKRSETAPASDGDRREVEGLLRGIHSAGKGVVGMKILAEGRLAHDPSKAFGFVTALPFLDAFVVGMFTEEEIKENCRFVNGTAPVARR